MKPVLVFLVLFFVSVGTATIVANVGAATQSSWTERLPTIEQNIPVTSNIGNVCTGLTQKLTLIELPGSHDVCTYGDDRLKIGYFSSSGPYRGAVKFPYSNEWHVLEGICGGVICRYSANTDQLVTQRAVGSTAWGLVVYKHASERIHRIQDGVVSKYVFDGNQPDYAVKNDVGRYLWTSSYGLSDNGKWLVVELHDSGLLLVDTDSFAERQITTIGYTYGYGRDPYEQLAVSNDGKSVLIAGTNVGLSVFDITPGCGQALVGDLRQLPLTTICPSAGLGIGTLFPNFHSSEQPRFFGNGQQLEIIVNSWVGSSKRLTFLQGGAPPVHKLKLLSLGDSFSSGEGETDARYYRSGTTGRYDTCHTSSRSYPFLIAKRIGVTSLDVQSVACSGATVADIIGPSDTYWGQGRRLGTTGLKLSPANKKAVQQEALDSFQPGWTLQSSFLERYSPEAITIGIGGNDAGLMGKLKACAAPGTCEWAQNQGLRATADEIRRLYASLGSLFGYISKHYPDTKVYIVGYPDIIDADGPCDASTRYLLNYSERIFIDKSVEYLNVVIRAAAQQAGFTFFDIEQSLNGKKLCSGSVSAAMNGVKFGDDIAIISSLPKLKVISSGSFHPTPLGHVMISDTILASHPGLRQDTGCFAITTVCGLSNVSIEPPSYWGAQSTTSRLSYAAEFAFPATADFRTVSLDIASGTFEPGSKVELSIRSEPAILGSFTTGSNGGLVGTVTIPQDFEDDYHTLHLLGTNREGVTVDLYQFITIGAADNAEVVGGSGSGLLGTLVTPVSNSSGSNGTNDTYGTTYNATGNEYLQSASLKPTAKVQVSTGAAADISARSTAVLGAQTVIPKSLNSFSIMPTITTQANYVKQFVERNKGVIVVAASLGLLVLAVLGVALIRRRWVKAGS